MPNPKGINQYTGRAKAAAAAKVSTAKSAAKTKALAAVGRKPAAPAAKPAAKPASQKTAANKSGGKPPANKSAAAQPRPLTSYPPPKPGTAVNLPPPPGAKAAAAKPAAVKNGKTPTGKSSVAAKPKGAEPGSPVAVKKARAAALGQQADRIRTETDAIKAKTGAKPKPKAWTPKKEDKVVVPANQAPGGKAITITKFTEMKYGTGSPQHLKALKTYATGAAELNRKMRKLYGPPAKPKTGR